MKISIMNTCVSWKLKDILNLMKYRNFWLSFKIDKPWNTLTILGIVIFFLKDYKDDQGQQQ